jgi:aminoglycoside 6'-N-acetyltransferase
MSTFEFDPIQRSDFPLLSEWLRTPHVARWWDDDPSLDAIEADYGDTVDGVEPAEVFIARCDGVPLGLVQRYRIHNYPQYVAELAPIISTPESACSIDYFVGPVEALGKGLGTAMIQAFVRTIWHDDAACSHIIVPVNVANRASWRALERAGFVCVANGHLTPDNPIDGTRHFIYGLQREVFRNRPQTSQAGARP